MSREDNSGTKTILIVEDEEDILRMTAFQLKAAGYEVVTAVDGEEALEEVRRGAPDLIILDLMLPKADGYRVCEVLKSDTKYKTIPIILVTASIKMKDIKLDPGARADAYIEKPYELSVMCLKIEELLKESRIDDGTGTDR